MPAPHTSAEWTAAHVAGASSPESVGTSMNKFPSGVPIDDPYLAPEQEQARRERIRQTVARGEITLTNLPQVTTTFHAHDIVDAVLNGPATPGKF